MTPPTVRADLPDTADRLVELYTALKKPAGVAKWKEERAKCKNVDPSHNR